MFVLTWRSADAPQVGHHARLGSRAFVGPLSRFPAFLVRRSVRKDWAPRQALDEGDAGTPRLNLPHRPGNIADEYSRVRLSDLETRSLTPAERALDAELPSGARVYRQDNLTSQSIGGDKGEGAASWFPVKIAGQEIRPSIKVRWKTNELGMRRLLYASRVELTGNSLAYVRYLDDFSATTINNAWTDIGGIQSRADPKVYVVQTPTTLTQRCTLMTTDPGDLVLDPTCRSGSAWRVLSRSKAVRPTACWAWTRTTS